MGLEIEAKVAVPDLKAVEERLKQLAAEDQGLVLESNVFFDTPSSRLKSADQGLRIRTTEPVDRRRRRATTITFKGPRARGLIKSREETELEVSDAQAAADLLMRLGFAIVFRFEKRRRTWKLDGCIVALDTVPHLGHFVEVEGPSEQAVLAALRRLELAERPMVTASYISLLLAYVDQQRLATDAITFADEQAAAQTPPPQPQPSL